MQTDTDSNLWDHKDTEQRAVIGEANTDNWNSVYTEFQLRVDSRLSPRYAYQCASSHFYEDPRIIEQIMEVHFGDSWENTVNQLNKDDTIFDENAANKSRYSYIPHKMRNRPIQLRGGF